MGEKNGLGEERRRKKKRKKKKRGKPSSIGFAVMANIFADGSESRTMAGWWKRQKLDHILLTIIDTVRNVDTKGKTFPQERKIGG